MSVDKWRATFVSAQELLREAADALDNDPSAREQAELMHPEDAWARAANALEVVTGLATAQTNKARDERAV